MTAGISITSHGPAVHIGPGKSTGWWGMMAMIATESIIFGLLLFTYLYFRAGADDWPPGDIAVPALTPTAIRSVILYASSGTLWFAERSLEKHGDAFKTAVWTFITMAMGAIFLTGHIQEQFRLAEEIAPQETAYGSIFMTLINFHIAHLIIGLMILGYMLLHTLRGRFSARRHTMFQMGGLYWHFVDVIWLFVFPTLYISPYLLRG